MSLSDLCIRLPDNMRSAIWTHVPWGFFFGCCNDPLILIILVMDGKYNSYILNVNFSHSQWPVLIQNSVLVIQNSMLILEFTHAHAVLHEQLV